MQVLLLAHKQQTKTFVSFLLHKTYLFLLVLKTLDRIKIYTKKFYYQVNGFLITILLFKTKPLLKVAPESTN